MSPGTRDDVDERDWTSVGYFDGPTPASIAAARLEAEGIPWRISRPGPPLRAPAIDWFISVPPDRAEEAKRLLATPAISEEELTAEALKYPPPDDV